MGINSLQINWNFIGGTPFISDKPYWDDFPFFLTSCDKNINSVCQNIAFISLGELFVAEKEQTSVWKCDFIARRVYPKQERSCPVTLIETPLISPSDTLKLLHSSKTPKVELRSSWKKFFQASGWWRRSSENVQWISAPSEPQISPGGKGFQGQVPRSSSQSTCENTRVYLCLSSLSHPLSARLQIAFAMGVTLVLNNSNPQSN